VRGVVAAFRAGLGHCTGRLLVDSMITALHTAHRKLPVGLRITGSYLWRRRAGRLALGAAILVTAVTLSAFREGADRTVTIIALVAGGALFFIGDVWRGLGREVSKDSVDGGETGYLALQAMAGTASGLLAGAAFGLLRPAPSPWLRAFGALAAIALTVYPILNEAHRRDRDALAPIREDKDVRLDTLSKAERTTVQDLFRAWTSKSLRFDKDRLAARREDAERAPSALTASQAQRLAVMEPEWHSLWLREHQARVRYGQSLHLNATVRGVLAAAAVAVLIGWAWAPLGVAALGLLGVVLLVYAAARRPYE